MKYLKFTVVTAITGLIFSLVGELLYGLIVADRSAVFTLPVYFLIFMIVLSIVIFITSCLSGTITSSKRKKAGGMFKKTIVAILIMAVLSGFLEFLYELGKNKVDEEPTSYIFLIDDSGSMKENDPKYERVKAIESIMADMDEDFPYAVYSFTDSCHEVKSVNENDKSLTFYSFGGTNIVKALKYVINDYDNYKSEWGENPKVLLLTDGQSSANGSISVLSKYKKNHIAVSTVGFGSANSFFLSNIAKKTGGVHIDSDDVDTLKYSMEKAIKAYSLNNRNLISDRYCNNDGLYAFLRIFFLILISITFSLIKSFATNNDDRWPVYFIRSFVLAIIASVFMEVLISGLYLPVSVAHSICCILWAILPVEIERKKRFVPVKTNFDDIDDDYSNDDYPDYRLGENSDQDDYSDKSLDF